jgi:alpha-D-ribose 1-methylphosphonate 5-triphosphate synthase subunit PhnL
VQSGFVRPSVVDYRLMARAVTVRGRLSDSRHIELDQPVDTPQGRVEVVVRSVDEAEKNDGASIVGLFADEPDLMDEVSGGAMAARERDSLRARGA